MKLSIQKFIVPGISFAMLLIVACVVLWTINFVTRYYFQQLPVHNTAFGEIENVLSWSKLTIEVAGFVLLLFNTFLLLQLNTKYSLIRTRTLLHGFLFLMTLSVWSAFDITFTDYLASTFVLFSLLMFMGMYRNKQAVREAFTGSMFIGIGSFFAPPLIYILSAFWAGFFLFQCISMRTFLASLFGIITPWILYFWFNWEFQPDKAWLDELRNVLTPELTVHFDENHKIVFIAINLILLLFGIGSFYNSLRLDSIQTRQRLKIFIWLFFLSAVTAFFYVSAFPAFLCVAAIAFSMLLAHPLTLQKSLLHSIMLIILCIVNVAFVIFNFLHYTA